PTPTTTTTATAAAIVTATTAAPTTTAPTTTAAPTPAPSYLQVLYLSQEGLTTNQIAADLGITVQAVQSYLGTPAAPAPAPTTNTTA
ncbi:MAG: hypothetical protein WAM67_18095, partial [Candidatus Acidiferrales bacterium]